MKARVWSLIVVFLFFFAINSWNICAENGTTVYHNVEQVDNVISTTYHKGNSENGNLMPYKKKVDTLNEQGVCVSKVTYLWDALNNSWEPFDKREYAYDGDALLSASHAKWNKRSNSWSKPQIVSYNN